MLLNMEMSERGTSEGMNRFNNILLRGKWLINIYNWCIINFKL
mgnify:CR=1 FL=1